MALLTELKRRHVIRVTIAYAVVGFVVVEVADIMFPGLGVPDWVMSVVTWAYVLGFAPVVILAWVFDWTPEGLKRDLGLAGPAAPEHSIAVLPFVNMSSDEEQEYFADGLTEELLNLLARVPHLRVAARTSAFAFKGKDVPIKEVAGTLNVAQVMEGSVRKSGDRVRITAQLIQASDGYHLWSETWDRRLEDIFELQDEIARAVADKLQIDVAQEDLPTVRPVDPEAYNLVLMSRHLVYQRTKETSDKAIADLNRAVEIAPDYSLAWTLLARAHHFRGTDYWGLGVPVEKDIRASQEALATALQLEPDSSDALECSAWLAWSYDWDWAKADRAIRRSLRANPHSERALNTAACIALTLGRTDEAVAIYEHAATLDPLSMPVHNNLALGYFYVDRLDEAEASIRKAIALSPTAAIHHYILTRILLQKGQVEMARQAIEQETHASARAAGIAIVLDAEGKSDEAQACLEEMMSLSSTPAFDLATSYALRDDADKAFEWLEKSRLERDGNLCDIRLLPEFRALHRDPRWQPFLEVIGLSDRQIEALNLEPFPLQGRPGT